MSEYEVYYDEYKLLLVTAEKFFDRLYHSIHYSLIFFTAICVFGFTNYSTSECLPFQLSFYYALPVFSFIFGLLFAYNSCVLAKIGCLGVKQEMALKIMMYNEYRSDRMASWITYSKQRSGGGYILAYGTVLMIYIVLPIFSIFFAHLQTGCVRYVPPNASILASTLPILFYIIYLVFMAIIIRNISRYVHDMKNVSINHSIGDVEIRTRPIIK